MSNLYSSPEKSGLRIFAELDDPNACYSFDTFVVWERLEDGALLYATDSGCSCPSPFEYVTSIEGLTEVDDSTESWQAFVQALDAWRDGNSSGSEDTIAAVRADAGELAGKVSMHLAKVADQQRRGIGYLSIGEYRNALERAAEQTKRAEKAYADYQEAYSERLAAVRAHKELMDMLVRLARGEDMTVTITEPDGTSSVVTITRAN